jgi:hypothetical protein
MPGTSRVTGEGAAAETPDSLTVNHAGDATGRDPLRPGPTLAFQSIVRGMALFGALERSGTPAVRIGTPPPRGGKR